MIRVFLDGMVELLHFWRGAKLLKQEIGVGTAGYDSSMSFFFFWIGDSSMFDVAYLVGKDDTL